MGDEAKGSILLVEGEAAVARSMKSGLEGLGYRVLAAPSGEEAVSAFGDGDGIDLLLVDLVLGGGIDGPETAARILERGSVPVLFLASHPEPEAVHRAEGVAPYGYLAADSGAAVIGASIQGALRRFAEGNRLQESESRFRNLLSDVECIAVQGYAPDGTTRYWNKASERLYGYAAEEAIGRSLLELIIPPGMREGVAEDMRRMAETGQPMPSAELSLMRKDGSRVPVFSSHTIVRAAGREAELFCIDIDLSERKRAEEALRESEEIFRRFMENSPVYVFFKDEEGRSLRLSANFENMLGKPLPELIGKSMDDLFPSELAKGMIADDQRILRENRQVVAEEELDGRYYTTIKFPISLGDEKRYLAGYTMDITERKRDEERIGNLLAEKEILLKEVHHRVKNNMNTMNSLLSLQAGNAKDPTAAAALKDAALRLQSMMVLYEKLYESDSIDALSALSYLPALVDDIVATFPNRASVRIEKRIEDFPIGVKKLQLLGIIVNELLTNTMKYAFAGRDRGLILISVSLDRDRVTLVLQDDGVGLPEAVDVHASTGFGLRLVAVLTKQLEGTLRVEREGGTRIVLAFDR